MKIKFIIKNKKIYRSRICHKIKRLSADFVIKEKIKSKTYNYVKDKMTVLSIRKKGKMIVLLKY